MKRRVLFSFVLGLISLLGASASWAGPPNPLSNHPAKTVTLGKSAILSSTAVPNPELAEGAQPTGGLAYRIEIYQPGGDDPILLVTRDGTDKGVILPLAKVLDRMANARRVVVWENRNEPMFEIVDVDLNGIVRIQPGETFRFQ